MNQNETVQQSTTATNPTQNVGLGSLPDTTTPPTLTTLPHFPTEADQLRRGDIQLLEVALKRGWPLSDKTKAETVKAAEWIRDNSKDPRARLRAAEFLLQIDKHQLEVVKAFRPQEVAVDITSNGKPLGDYSGLSIEELEARKAALTASKALPQ